MVKKSKTADIISTVLHIVLNTENNLQSTKDLKPINWCKNVSELEIQNKMKTLLKNVNVTLEFIDFDIYSSY